MKWFILITVLAGMVQVQDAQAFNRKRCAKIFPGGSSFGDKGQFHTSWISASTSTSQFSSSTGDCRLIGGTSKSEREYFIADNSELIMKDIVLAEGDYLAAVGVLYNCDDLAYDQMALRLQQNATTIFGENLDHAPAQVSIQLDSLMQTDSTLKRICSMQG